MDPGLINLCIPDPSINTIQMQALTIESFLAGLPIDWAKPSSLQGFEYPQGLIHIPADIGVVDEVPA